MEINNDIESLSRVENSLGKKLFAMLIFFVSFLIIVAATIIKFALIERIRGKNSALSYVSIILGVAFLLSSLAIYYFFSRSALTSSLKYLMAQITAMTLVYVICLYTSIAGIYFMPVFLTAYFVAPIAKRSDAFILNIACNIMLMFSLVVQEYLSLSGNYMPILTMFVIGVIIGTLISYSVSYDIKRLNFIIKGLIVGIISLLILTCLTFAYADFSDIPDKLLPMAIAVLLQLFLGLLGQPVFETIFNLVTNSRLIELADHNQPLIKLLMEKAPGTFNHSLSVANYAEICATAIGENPYLARACAYYHDIGKIENPEYFSENQSDHNPHDELLPEVSAEIIRNHTYQGLELCKKYRIPDEITAVTIQHHGTLPMIVFYNKAKQMTDSMVDIKDYSYNGFTPVTKIAAIIMICDSSEAAIRAMDKPDGEKVDRLLRMLISDRIERGQFDNCNITLKDLDIIRETIIAAYGGQYHKRVSYPEGEKQSDHN